MTHCKTCSEKTLHYLWNDTSGGSWYRCLFCGCDSSSRCYAETSKMYNASYINTHHGGHTNEHLLQELRPNLDWFVDWKVKDDVGKDFLDVGCCEGLAMRGMQDRGYSVHGFDVIPEAAREGCTTIAPVFRAGLFPQKYHAVLCREVIEHVDTPMQFMTELSYVTHGGGFLQLQTPRPTEAFNPIGYQQAHICLLSPFWIRYWLERLGFEIKDYRIWDMGQVWLCKKH